MNKKTKKLASVFLCFTMLHQNFVIAFATEIASHEQVQNSSYSMENTNPIEPAESAKPAAPAKPIASEDEKEIVDNNELAPKNVPLVDLSRYSASIRWSETDDSQPNFSCSPAWNPETHSYDQWEFTANSPLVVQNTSEGSTVITIEVFFNSNMQANRQLTLSPDEVGKSFIIVILASGEEKNIYLSISSTDPMLGATDEVCVGMISYRITTAVSADENGQLSETVAQKQPVNPSASVDQKQSVNPEPSVDPSPSVDPKQPELPLEDVSIDETLQGHIVASAKAANESSLPHSSESSEPPCNVQSENLPEENNNAKSNDKT